VPCPSTAPVDLATPVKGITVSVDESWLDRLKHGDNLATLAKVQQFRKGENLCPAPARLPQNRQNSRVSEFSRQARNHRLTRKSGTAKQ
jgi:hypothetical protein